MWAGGVGRQSLAPQTVIGDEEPSTLEMTKSWSSRARIVCQGRQVVFQLAEMAVPRRCSPAPAPKRIPAANAARRFRHEHRKRPTTTTLSGRGASCA